VEDAAVLDVAALTAQALDASAAMKLVDAEIAEAEARAALARAQQYPDPTLEGALTHDSPPDFEYGWRFAVSIAIPIFTHHGAGVRVEEATLARLRVEREALSERLRGDVAAAAARASAHRQAYLRFRDEVLPRAKDVDAMSEDSYRSGQTGLVALLQSLQTTREIRSKAVDAAFQYQSAIADLEEAIAVGPK
jgi:outer membrane protein TolC